MPIVSIIIPCRNDGLYLRESLASAKEQTLADCETIIVDDHSTDSLTLEVLNNLEASGQMVLRMPEDKRGVAAARNYGIALAQGKYILPLDADDRIAPKYAQEASNILENNPDIGVCYCGARYFGLKRGRWNLQPYSFGSLLLRNSVFVSSMFRKKDWAKIGGFDEEAYREDHVFWLELSASGLGFHQIPEDLFYYRIKKHSRSARLPFWKDVAMQTFERCEKIYRDNVRLLYEQTMELDREKEMREKLLFWRFCRPLLGAEQKAREFIKGLLGRRAGIS